MFKMNIKMECQFRTDNVEYGVNRIPGIFNGLYYFPGRRGTSKEHKSPTSTRKQKPKLPQGQISPSSLWNQAQIS